MTPVDHMPDNHDNYTSGQLPECLPDGDQTSNGSGNGSVTSCVGHDVTKKSLNFAACGRSSLLTARHVNSEPGNFTAAVNASGFVTEVTKHDWIIYSVIAGAVHRPKLRDLVGKLRLLVGFT